MFGILNEILGIFTELLLFAGALINCELFDISFDIF
jgi:hypothetical protein